jgi:hypothetical protein
MPGKWMSLSVLTRSRARCTSLHYDPAASICDSSILGERVSYEMFFSGSCEPERSSLQCSDKCRPNVSV